jgi:hypothetical protein
MEVQIEFELAEKRLNLTNKKISIN